MHIAAVQKRIEQYNRVAHSNADIAVGCVLVRTYLVAIFIQKRHHITLQVGDVVEHVAIHRHAHRSAGCIVGKYKLIRGSIVRPGHRRQLGSIVHVAVGDAAVGSLGPQAVGIVSVSPVGAAVGHGGQLAAMLPGIFPGAVVGRITDLIISNCDTVKSGQQVTPVRVAVGVSNGIDNCAQLTGGVGILCPAQDISRIIIGPVLRLVVLPGQLIGGVWK